MCPGPQAEGHDAPGLADERVPSVAAVIHNVGVGGEDAVREPVVAHELPDVLDGVELRRSRRQGQERDVVGYDEVMRAMPTCLVEQQHRVGAGGDGGRDLGEVERHPLGVAARQDERCALALSRTDGAVDVGGRGALVVRRRWSRSTSCPAARDAVLLADTCFVLPPQLYGRAARETCADRRQLGGEVFLKAGMALASWAWWRGRADSLR